MRAEYYNSTKERTELDYAMIKQLIPTFDFQLQGPDHFPGTVNI